MKTSTDRILTTHVGSLPRHPDVLAQVMKQELGEAVDAAVFAPRLAAAVRDVVAKQVAAGIDSVCDG
jgi:5-methyltetrahydropteroyltriglutamate--homocysteine methyltransferase